MNSVRTIRSPLLEPSSTLAPAPCTLFRFDGVSFLQEEQAREDAKTLAILNEQARIELERRQNQAASQIQRVLREYVVRQIANKGKGKKGGGKGKGGKKKKK